MASYRPPKPWYLKEEETITSFASWQSNQKYHLSLNNEYASFIDPTCTWSKASVANRGLTADPTEQANGRTAAQKNAHLEAMLGLIAQFAPSLIRNDIIKKSTSLSWIWQRIRQHYGFRKSEINFLSISKIKRTEGERHETLYQRLIAHVEDNLLTTDSNITHDGVAITANEEMSPTCERLLVYLWLNLIDERLPAYVSRVYAHDLMSKSLKDIQPQICHSMDSLLSELNAQEDIQINYGRSTPSRRGRTTPSNPGRRVQANNQKSCILCKAANRQHLGHDVGSCWFLSKFDRLEITRALQISVEDIEEEDESSEQHLVVTEEIDVVADETEAVTRRVSCEPSPFIYTFYKHHHCKILIDTGATSSMVSISFVQRVNLKLLTTQQGAKQLDKTPVNVLGEVKFEVSFGSINLVIEALVTDCMDYDVLGGIPFGKANDIVVHLRGEYLTIKGKRFPYGAKPSPPVHDIRLTDSVILRNDASRVLFPGEFVEIASDSLSEYEGDISIEPRLDSPMQGTWPSPAVSRVIQGTIRIPNDTDEPIHLPKSKHFAQIRRITNPSTRSVVTLHPTESAAQPSQGKNSHSSSVTIDPDNQLSPLEKEQFRKLLVSYDNVFNKVFGVYNGASGPYKASINLGPVRPPSTKPQIPFYPQNSMRLLQEEADKLEMAGVLQRPEDLGVEVKFTSPSFLVKKPDGTHRFVTAFNELGMYTNVLPTASPSCDEVMRRLSSFKYIVKSDLTKSFFQIPVTKDSMQYLGTVTPYKGIRVYTRTAMGMPGSSEHLRELLTRVLGDYMSEGFVVVKDDDMYIGAHESIAELLSNWEKVIHRMQLNNLYLSASKTVIAPRRTTVLGWNWESGTISVPPHKIAPLAGSDPPKTCSAMRSFIGAYKALSRCIPKYSSLISPLENSIKGLQGNSSIQWDSDLTLHFRNAQNALKNPRVLTIPTKCDPLTMTVDASPVNDGISATLFVSRNSKLLVADNFSLKLKSHQTGWQPCEMEALAITAAVKHFSPYVRESIHPLSIFTDNKPCIQAYNKLLKGHFSASARLSTFLSCLSEYNITLSHIKGSDNTISDYGSRNPQECKDKSCQICKFVEETSMSVVRRVSVSDVLSGSARMPFLNQQAWKSAQHECHELRRTFAHLRAGTRPSRKSRGMKNVKRYLNLATINENGVLIVRKPDPYLHQRKLTIVPKDILPGILLALHLHFTHCTESQLKKLFNRYFYCIGSDAVIKSVVGNCHQCASLCRIPKEMFEQTSSASPSTIGQQFAADVIRRQAQCIFALRDIHSSFTTAQIIPDEKAPTLEAALVSNSSLLRGPTCEVRVDNAPGFLALKDSPVLTSHGISLDYGRVKNVNKNPCAEKCNQELELELLKVDSSGSAVSDSTLQTAVRVLNSRIRNRGLSAKEIVTCRDQVSHKLLPINDELLSKQQEEIRERNHPVSARSKAPNAAPAAGDPHITSGSLVFIKSEGDKFRPRERYIVVSISDNMATIQKFGGERFMSKQYNLPINQLYAIKPGPTELAIDDDSSSSDDDSATLSSSSDGEDDGATEQAQPTEGLRRSNRRRQPPDWLVSGEWET